MKARCNIWGRGRDLILRKKKNVERINFEKRRRGVYFSGGKKEETSWQRKEKGEKKLGRGLTLSWGGGEGFERGISCERRSFDSGKGLESLRRRKEVLQFRGRKREADSSRKKNLGETEGRTERGDPECGGKRGGPP